MKTEAEIEGLFALNLHDSEEILWLGSNEIFAGRGNIIKAIAPFCILLGVVYTPIAIGVYGLSIGFPFALIILLFIPLLIGETHRAIPKLLSELSLNRYYVITNQSILVSWQSKIYQSRLSTISEIILSKPKNGRITISIYYHTNNEDKFPNASLQLKGIAEEEAQAVYEILRQAREEALEDRAREMGIE